MKLFCTILSMLLLTFAAPKAEALTVYDPTNHSENLATKLQLIKSYEKQLEQIQHELANLAKLDDMQLSASLSKLQELIGTINTIREETNAVCTDYRTAMQELDELRPDYRSWNGVAGEEYARQVDRLREAWERSVEQALLTQGIVSPDEIKKTGDAVARILQASQNAEGAVGVTQAANQMLALQIEQLTKMQAIMADSMRTQDLFFQRQIDAEKAAEKRKEEFMRDQTDYSESMIRETHQKAGEYYDE